MFEQHTGQDQDREAEIEARLAAATPGPWRWVSYSDDDWWVLETQDGVRVLDDGSACGEYMQKIDPDSADGILVEAVPADIGYLLAEIKRLRSLLETEQRARWGAEQDTQYWQEQAEALEAATGAGGDGGKMTTELKIPCPSCTFRGPVWLQADGSCIYCGTTWSQDDFADVWNVVPWEWWLAYGMIKPDELPQEVTQ